MLDFTPSRTQHSWRSRLQQILKVKDDAVKKEHVFLCKMPACINICKHVYLKYLKHRKRTVKDISTKVKTMMFNKEYGNAGGKSNTGVIF